MDDLETRRGLGDGGPSLSLRPRPMPAKARRSPLDSPIMRRYKPAMMCDRILSLLRWRNAATIVLSLGFGLMGCTGMVSRAPKPVPEEPVPTPITIATVPVGTPTPVDAKPLATRPIENPEAAKAKAAGKAIGPVITFLGIARADGRPYVADPQEKGGIPVFSNFVGSGFLLVVEAKPGISNVAIGRRIYVFDPDDPKKRPDLEIQVSRPLGDGSKDVCDARRPNIGGIAGIDPPSFAETAEVSATLNDLSCRFEIFTASGESCTLNKFGDFSFIEKDTDTQFCMVVARAWNFEYGDTLVSARLRDEKGNPGPVSKFWLRRPKARPTPRPVVRTPQPTAPRRRP